MSETSLITIRYKESKKKPSSNIQTITAQYDKFGVIVYQAFNDKIANYAIKNQQFGGDVYSFDRMSWIKPNFLWMMHRSGWGSKQNQNRILSIKIKTDFFNYLICNGIKSSFDKNTYASDLEWKEELQNSDIRIQWDPNYNAFDEKTDTKAIQIGLKKCSLREFNKNIIHIEDISSFIQCQKLNIHENKEFYVPLEEEYIVNPDSHR